MNATTNDVDPLDSRPVFDPESAPHDPVFASAEARGQPIEPAELRASAMRHRFAVPPPWTPELRTDIRLFYPDRPARAASVLIPLVVSTDHVGVLLTQRTAHLSDHAGQISFPGGRVEKRDADAIATALREAHEEIGLPPTHVDVIGTLPA